MPLEVGDKGVYKAITGAVKYIFMKNFLIPTGDDPEKDNNKSEPEKKETIDDRETLTHDRKFISEKQGNRLWAIGRSKGIMEDKVAAHIFNKYGYNNNTEIETKNYDAIVF